MESKVIPNVKLALLGLFSIICASCGSLQKHAGNASITTTKKEESSSKVLVVFLENEGFDKAMEQPYLSYIASQGALLTNYHAVTQRSQPNYIAFVAGDTFGIANDSPVTLDKKNIADLLEEHGKTWGVYAEDYPGDCYLATRFKQYNRKQNPLISFKGIQESPERCGNIIGADRFNADLANNSLPDFAMYVPNQLNSGHDSDVNTAAKWLKTFLDPIVVNSSVLEKTLIIVVFDESFFPGHQNNIYAVMLGKGVQKGAVSNEHYSHYNMLRTVQDFLGIGNLGKHDSRASRVSGIWDNDESAVGKK